MVIINPLSLSSQVWEFVILSKLYEGKESNDKSSFQQQQQAINPYYLGSATWIFSFHVVLLRAQILDKAIQIIVWSFYWTLFRSTSSSSTTLHLKSFHFFYGGIYKLS